MHLYIRGKKNNIQYSTIIFAWVHVLYNTHAENTLNLKKEGIHVHIQISG